MSESIEKRKNGIALKHLFAVMSVIVVAVLIVLVMNAVKIDRSYKALDKAAKDYDYASTGAFEMKDASDYLTEQVRDFTFSPDKVYLDRYFEEAQQTKRRDKAVETIRESLMDISPESVGYLEESLRLSNELMELEYRAFRLAAEGSGMDLSGLPEEIRNVRLSAEDAALLPEEKTAKAVSIVYGRDYQETKSRIYNNADLCTNRLIEIIRQREIDYSGRLGSQLTLQFVLLAVIFVIVILYFVFTDRLVIRPIRAFVNSIKDNSKMQGCALKEIDFLANSYNEMIGKMQDDQSKLSYDATHDALTGLYNRAAYEDIMERHKDDPIAFIIIDVDGFKQFNDMYGHATGDKVLKRVSGVLRKNFRSDDYVCRIGGDEFAVIMVNSDSGLKGLVRDKLERIAGALREKDDETPSITLSIGVAFSDRQDPKGSIFEDADSALYKAKENGKNGYAFY